MYRESASPPASASASACNGSVIDRITGHDQRSTVSQQLPPQSRTSALHESLPWPYLFIVQRIHYVLTHPHGTWRRCICSKRAVQRHTRQRTRQARLLLAASQRKRYRYPPQAMPSANPPTGKKDAQIPGHLYTYGEQQSAPPRATSSILCPAPSTSSTPRGLAYALADTRSSSRAFRPGEGFRRGTKEEEEGDAQTFVSGPNNRALYTFAVSAPGEQGEGSSLHLSPPAERAAVASSVPTPFSNSAGEGPEGQASRTQQAVGDAVPQTRPAPQSGIHITCCREGGTTHASA